MIRKAIIVVLTLGLVGTAWAWVVSLKPVVTINNVHDHGECWRVDLWGDTFLHAWVNRGIVAVAYNSVVPASQAVQESGKWHLKCVAYFRQQYRPCMLHKDHRTT